MAGGILKRWDEAELAWKQVGLTADLDQFVTKETFDNATGPSGNVAPLTVNQTFSSTRGSDVQVSANAYQTVLDVAGPVTLLAGSIVGSRQGWRITVDGVEMRDLPNHTNGRTDGGAVSDLFAVIALPSVYAVSSLKVELVNVSDTARRYGWSIITRNE